VNSLSGRENFGHDAHEARGKIGSFQIGLQKGALRGLGNFLEFFIGAQTMGKNAAGNGVVEKIANGLNFAGIFQAAQI
jgi:hypothetical protein